MHADAIRADQVIRDHRSIEHARINHGYDREMHRCRPRIAIEAVTKQAEQGRARSDRHRMSAKSRSAPPSPNPQRSRIRARWR